MTPHNYEIVDCGAFCEVIFFCISPKNLLGDFFDSLGSDIHLTKLQEQAIIRSENFHDPSPLIQNHPYGEFTKKIISSFYSPYCSQN